MKVDTCGKRYLHTFHVAFVTLQINRRCFLHIIWRWYPLTLEVYGKPWDVNFAENER
jgi:hypothetical protein